MKDFLVIGSGISGLLCARQLADGGHTVTVLDKGRKPGGRMATRDLGELRFDHGAQYFTVRDPRFDRWLRQWQDDGIVFDWYGEQLDGKPRYAAKGGMASIGAWLAGPLDLRQGAKVVALSRIGSAWQAITAENEVFSAGHLVLTMPAPQLIPLLQTSGIRLESDLLERLRAVEYERSIACLLTMDAGGGLEAPGAFQLKDSVVSWMADNAQKGISPRPSITLHSNPEFAAIHWDSPDSLRGPPLIEAVAERIRGGIREFRCHRWGFAKPTTTTGLPFFYDPVLQLGMAGDSFGGPRIESAALSGMDLAEHLLACAFSRV